MSLTPPSSRALGRRAFTLVEVVTVATIIGLVTFVGIGGIRHFLDRIATRDAVRAAGGAIARARDEAIASRTLVSVRIDTVAATLTLVAGGTAFGEVALREVHGVSISSNRDSITLDARGLGLGAANLTFVAQRGAAADTLVVSRLGRVRY